MLRLSFSIRYLKDKKLYLLIQVYHKSQALHSPSSTTVATSLMKRDRG